MTEIRQKKIKIELFNDHFQNYKRYQIPKEKMLNVNYAFEKEQQQSKQRGQTSIFDFIEVK